MLKYTLKSQDKVYNKGKQLLQTIDVEFKLALSQSWEANISNKTISMNNPVLETKYCMKGKLLEVEETAQPLSALLLLQRTWVRSPATTGELRNTCTSSSRGANALVTYDPTCLACGAHMQVRQTLIKDITQYFPHILQLHCDCYNK